MVALNRGDVSLETLRESVIGFKVRVGGQFSVTVNFITGAVMSQTKSSVQTKQGKKPINMKTNNGSVVSLPVASQQLLNNYFIKT